jgi:hypothetical protein
VSDWKRHMNIVHTDRVIIAGVGITGALNPFSPERRHISTWF